MSKKTMQKAARESRVAVCPEWLRVGRQIVYWRECLCMDDVCMDAVTTACPLNAGHRTLDPEALVCARQHPVLETAMVWSVCAYFTPGGIEWSINDLPAVPDERMRRVFFPDREAAERCRPREVM